MQRTIVVIYQLRVKLKLIKAKKRLTQIKAYELVVKDSERINRLNKSYFQAFQALIKPLVEQSWLSTQSSLLNSGKICPASCLPNSTPH